MSLTILNPRSHSISKTRTEWMRDFFSAPPALSSPLLLPTYLLSAAALARALHLDAGSGRGKGTSREGQAKLRC